MWTAWSKFVQKGILEMKLIISIIKFRISILEYPYVPNFI